jgi:hypothetical protein
MYINVTETSPVPYNATNALLMHAYILKVSPLLRVGAQDNIDTCGGPVIAQVGKDNYAMLSIPPTVTVSNPLNSARVSMTWGSAVGYHAGTGAGPAVPPPSYANPCRRCVSVRCGLFQISRMSQVAVPRQWGPVLLACHSDSEHSSPGELGQCLWHVLCTLGGAFQQ